MPGQHYRVVHRTEYRYGAVMSDGYSVACVLARPTPSQNVLSSVVTTDPAADEYDERTDVFGNRVVQMGLHQPHDGLTVEAITEAVVWAQELPRVDVAWERVSATIAGLRGPMALDVAPFAAPSRFVSVDLDRLGLFEVVSASFRPGRSIVEATIAFCTEIFESFVFDSTFTEVSTPLDVVLRERRGVCQDFAHLAVGCLRTLGLAARYVSGYIETEPPPGEPKVFGADASHAWCSIWIPDHGWLDFDPTNGVVAPSRHVTIGWGRDYADVAPVRGVVVGPASEQSLTVSVDVARV
ncbi:MAG TPA: transglutaminase family protein [Ilumatobacteraceae bacterium]|nr:transglutaminase family protein [Ilumatobacteraceae bacterium]